MLSRNSIEKGWPAKEPADVRIEPRWPVLLTLAAVVFLLQGLPGRVRMFDEWVPYALGVLVFVPMSAVGLTGGRPAWLKLERTATLLFVVIAGAGTLVNLTTLIRAMVFKSAAISGLQLLASSIAIWITNVLAFSLLYWQLDRGGPEARVRKRPARPDWSFPQDSVPQSVAPDWRPTFVDYLFLAFSTATAFSPTSALPLTPRAMMLMMFESTNSLITIVVVAARSINILGS